MEPNSLSLELLPLEFKMAEPTPLDQADTVVGDPPADFVPAAEEFVLPKLEMVGFDVAKPNTEDALPTLEMLEPGVVAPVSDTPSPALSAGNPVAIPAEAAAAGVPVAEELPPPAPVLMRPGTTSTVGPPTDLERDAIAAAAPNPDKFLAEAIKEITDGRRDNALWAWAVAQGNGDQAAAIGAYMRARATALRVLDRDQRAMKRAQASKAAGVGRGKPGGLVNDEDDEATFVQPKAAKSGMRFAPAIAGGFATLALVGWFLMSSWGSRADAAAEAAKPAVNPASVAAAAAAAAAKSAGAAEPEKGASPELLAKIEALHAAGNWNVLVLHAVEWTRRDPQSAAAWNELSFGYAQLRQYRDAGDAAMKAVALAPKDPRYLANLGQIKLDLNEPAEALRLFEEATAADALDVRSFVQAGILHAQMGHPAEARSALDRAMALGPDYPGALCLKALLARPAPQKEVSTTQPRQPDGKCVSPGDAVAVTVPSAPKQVAHK
jgi:tetratricopeptide (TPR) repeat protein